MTTITLVEPIVAEAVAYLLMEKDTGGKHFWVQSIKPLTQKLLNPGLIEKGLRGERFARIVLVLARDYYIYKSMTRADDHHLGEDDNQEMRGSDAKLVEPTPEDDSIPDADEPSMAITDEFDYARPFKVVGFLQHLFGWKNLETIPSVYNTSHHSHTSQGEPSTLGVAFQDAVMNFSHFTPRRQF